MKLQLSYFDCLGILQKRVTQEFFGDNFYEAITTVRDRFRLGERPGLENSLYNEYHLLIESVEENLARFFFVEDLKPDLSSFPDSMLRVDGKVFRCDCGANVFKKIEVNGNYSLYSCNGCGNEYMGEKDVPTPA